MNKYMLTIGMAIAIFMLAGCENNIAPPEYRAPQDYTEYVPITEDILEDDGTTVRLSLGDTFVFQTMEVTLGREIEFVSYTRTFDYDLERGTAYWNPPGTQHEKALYIPVAIMDREEDPRQVGTHIWQLRGSEYTSPAGEGRTVWHEPGGEDMMNFFPWSAQYMDSVCGEHSFYHVINEPYGESFIRLEYSGDGDYVLQFVLREGGWNTEIVQIFELPLDIIWPQSPTEITVAHIERRPDERVAIGNFEVAVGAEAVSEWDDDTGVGTTLFPVSLTNIGMDYECISSLNSMALNSNSGFPTVIGNIRLGGVDIDFADIPAIAPGESLRFYLPITAVVCENTAAFRPFRFTEKRTEESALVVTHNHYEFCLPWCWWCC